MSNSKSVIHDLFGPLDQYMEAVVSHSNGAVGKLSAAHPLIQLFVYEKSEDTPNIRPEQQYISQTKTISKAFINAVLGCSDHLRTLDVSATSGSFVRVTLDRIIGILSQSGSIVASRSSASARSFGEESAPAPAPEEATTYNVSTKATEQVTSMLQSMRDPQLKHFIEEALKILGRSQYEAANEQEAINAYTGELTAKMHDMFDTTTSRSSGNVDIILRKLATATSNELNTFDLYFSVHDLKTPTDSIPSSKFGTVLRSDVSTFRINVKNKSTQNPGLWMEEKYQKGGVAQRMPLWNLALPLLEPTDLLMNKNGTSDGAQDASILRKIAAAQFYNDAEDKKIGAHYGNPSQTPLSIPYEAWMKYIACSDKPNNVFRTASSAVNPPELNLTRDYWVKRTDGKYETKQLDGSYKVLSTEECYELTNRNCASSLVTSNCSEFMEAVIRGDISKLKDYLRADSFSWNQAEKDLNQMKPNVVLEILKAFGFGPYTNSFGTEKQMCSVEDWLKQPETVKNFGAGKKVDIDGKLKSYLELLVAFVNKNKSILNPHLQKQATGSIPEEVSRFGVYDGTVPLDNSYPASGCNGPINWSQLRQSADIFAPQFGSTNVFDPQNPMQYLSNLPGHQFTGQVLFGLGQGGQRGGALFSQQGVTEVSASSDIKNQLDSVIQMLRQSNKGLSQEDEASLNRKVASFTQLEQDLWEQLCKLNRYRECLSMCGDTTPDTVLLKDLDELVQKYKHTGAKYNTNNDCLQNLCYMLTQLLTQNTSNGSARTITPLH
jgi:hypothetical protein